jgi:hypothetical protein
VRHAPPAPSNRSPTGLSRIMHPLRRRSRQTLSASLKGPLQPRTSARGGCGPGTRLQSAASRCCVPLGAWCFLCRPPTTLLTCRPLISVGWLACRLYECGHRIGLSQGLRGRFRPSPARHELLRSLLVLLVVLQGGTWHLTLVQAEGVAREGGKAPSVRAFTMAEHTSNGASSLSTASAPPALFQAPPITSASDPIPLSDIAIGEEAGVMQGLKAEASSHEITPKSGSSLMRAHDRRLVASSPTTLFDLSSTSTTGWSTRGGGACCFSRLLGRTSSDYTGHSAGVGGSGNDNYAEASSPRACTLSYDGSACASSGLLVATVRFSFHIHGSAMGTLSLIDAAGFPVWSRSGDQGNAWLNVSIVLLSTSFHFEYVPGGGDKGWRCSRAGWCELRNGGSSANAGRFDNDLESGEWLVLLSDHAGWHVRDGR